MQSVTTSDMQAYIDKRLRDSYRKKPIRPDTVRKEVATFRLIWNWAVTHGHVVGPAPTKGLKYPKTEQKPPFMTREEIEKVIKRGGLTEKQEAGLWECLFLTISEVQEVLDLREKERPTTTSSIPMFVFVAHTGARRSEILRAQIDDFDFQSKTVLIREKKRSHDKSLSYRRVRMSELLATHHARMVRQASRRSARDLRAGEDHPRQDPRGRRPAYQNGSPRPLQADPGEEQVGQDPWLPRVPPFVSRPTSPRPASISGSSTNGWATRPRKCGNATGTCCPISSRPRSI